ncbi:FeoA family protein [Pantanalinema rosaneae CENA516]|uniref:FeoA family protein n=1 Tax=Pantanalinema rosaneae TaxID=1620701 RepID=UPI003D6EA8E4
MNRGDDLVNAWTEDLGASAWQEFVYLGDAIADRCDPSSPVDLPAVVPENSQDHRVFPLSNTRVGEQIRIVALNCGEANNRLMGMGLMPDVVLKVISCTATGSVIVALHDQRLGLGAEMAQNIQVMNAQPLTGEPPMRTTRTITMQSTSPSSSVKLRDAAIGSMLRVMGYEPVARDYKRKLLAMGLTPGTELRVTRHAPLGDPTEIEVRGFHLSLRKAEADALIVELI